MTSAAKDEKNVVAKNGGGGPLAGHVPSLIGRQPFTNIWVEFGGLAQQCGAVNFGQGFTDGPIPKQLARHLADVAAHPEMVGCHQYTRSYGHPRLTAVLARLYQRLLQRPNPIDPTHEVLITVGAYMSLYYTFLGWVNPGDEVIIFEPAFDSYVNQIRMNGGIPVPLVLELDEGARSADAYRLDVDGLRAAVTPKTRMIVVNNPNNPTGKLFTRQELEAIAAVARENDLLVVADEVYEFMVYPDSGEMIRFATLPGMAERTVTIGSAGKVWSATGWKIGWSIAPKALLEPLKRVHENCIYTVSTPTQEALARAFEEELGLLERGVVEGSYLQPGAPTSLAAELRANRDLLATHLEAAGFRPILPSAGYFIIADFGHLKGPFWTEPPGAQGEADPVDYRFARWLCREKKLATIPPSAFYSPENRPGRDHFVRLCFFKQPETLASGIAILSQLHLGDDGEGNEKKN